MILVLLGTQNKSFDRVLKEIDKLKKNKLLRDKVVAQTGCTTYESKYIKTFDYVSKEEITKLIDEAKIVITHGGVGVITECLDKGKKTIVVPRLSKYKEHTNDHQLEITKEFAENGYILPVYNEKKLLDAIKESKNFVPKKYVSNNKKFIKAIKNYIDL